MSLLSFISDEELKDAVDKLLRCALGALDKANLKFTKNVIDPFSAMFEMAGFGIDQATWRKNEKMRKAQKTLSNHIGSFHQTILGHVKGWENPGAGGGVDLVSKENQIIAEIKNKHNTVKGSDLAHLYDELEELVMPKASKYKDYTAYCVFIIPKNATPFDTFFVPSSRSTGYKRPENDKIRKIDGYSFYQIVTGVEDALLQLFKILPKVIQVSEYARGFHFKDAEFLQEFFDAAFGKSS